MKILTSIFSLQLKVFKKLKQEKDFVFKLQTSTPENVKKQLLILSLAKQFKYTFHCRAKAKAWKKYLEI